MKLLAVVTDDQESYRATEAVTLYSTLGKCFLAVLPSELVGWCSHMQPGTVTASRFIASM